MDWMTTEPGGPVIPGRDRVIARTVDALCSPDSLAGVSHRDRHAMPLPSVETLAEILDLLRSVLFPGYFGPSELSGDAIRYHTGATLDRVARLLSEQIRRGFCFVCSETTESVCAECGERAGRITAAFLEQLPGVRELLAGDVQAAYEGDPAARNPGETIFCYPSIRAVASQRIAHRLYRMEVPLIPRIVTEIAHSQTGIDIHPGAEIGPRFFIDHGTGVVIGETAVIGAGVRIYQGVTLGAKSFALDDRGLPVKGVARHPIVEDGAVIYSGATILGRITIGKGAVIGGNVWLTESVPPGARIVQNRHRSAGFENGGGI